MSSLETDNSYCDSLGQQSTTEELEEITSFLCLAAIQKSPWEVEKQTIPLHSCFHTL